jgi:outer membrane biosynthesis protein TonB
VSRAATTLPSATASALPSLFSRLSLLSKAAILAALVALVVTLWSLVGLSRAILAPSATSKNSAANDQQRAEEHKKSFEKLLAQIDGRTMFFTPAPRPTETPSQPEETTPTDTTPPKPSTYAGPKLVAMINNEAWFDNKQRYAAGGEVKDDLRVVRLAPPWEAVVEWKGVEFTVSLFARDRVVLKKVDSPAAPAGEAPDAAEPAETPDAPAREPAKAPAKEPVKPAEPPKPQETPKPAEPAPTPEPQPEPQPQPQPEPQPQPQPEPQPENPDKPKDPTR